MRWLRENEKERKEWAGVISPWEWYWGMVYNRLFQAELRVRRIKCWFVGHDVRGGVPYEPDWCDRCYIEDPDDRRLLPGLLNRTYVWLVERDWAWFERFDDWMFDKHQKRLPSWWKY